MSFNQSPKKSFRKKWETPRLEIIDSAQSGSRGGFVERGIENSRYYIAPEVNPAGRFTASKTAYLRYVNS